MGEVVTPAILGRSLLEISSSFIENANILHRNIKNLPPHNPGVVEIFEYLEKLVVRILFGTRFGSEIPEHLQQKNILTTIQKLTKVPNVSDLLPNYEFLSEITHPNVIGNARFWTEISHSNKDGCVFRSKVACNSTRW